jgi:hypothetical protein
MLYKKTSLAIIGVLAVVVAGAAAAQTAGSIAPPVQILSAPDQVRACLCAEHSLAQQSDALSKRRAAYEQMKQELTALDTRVLTERPKVNVNDPNAVAAFRQLLEKRDVTQRNFAGDQTTQLDQAVGQYNQGVADFNRDCASKSYDAGVLSQVRGNLTCPAQ